MAKQKSNGARLILLGLIVAFLYSVLAIPLDDSSVEDSHERNLSLTQSTSTHSSHHAPISLPGEEKEEENRAEKDSKFTLDVPESLFEFSLNLQVETIYYHTDQTQSALTADIPLYLLKSSFLI